MSGRAWLVRSVEVLVFLGAVALILGQLLGQPVLLSYVTSGSMEPTIGSGDGFVAIPSAVTGSIGEGDVVVFQAESVNDGAMTTHRVVGETEEGFITKGDANPFTDQSKGEPPVKGAQIEGEALQVAGNVVVLPHLGRVAEGTKSVIASIQEALASVLGTRVVLGVQGFAYLLFVLSIAWYAFETWRESSRKIRKRGVRSRRTGMDTRLIVGAITVLVVLSATGAMVGPSGVYQFDVVSSGFESDRPGVIEAGSTESNALGIPNDGFVPVFVFLEPSSDGIEVKPQELRIDARDQTTATVTLSAPAEKGVYRRYLGQHRYLALLPKDVIRALYDVHQWLPILAIDALIGIPFYLIGVRLVGTGRMRSRERDNPSRVVRLFRRYS